MICKTCANAADCGLGPHAHCQDAGCTCQHRHIVGEPRIHLVTVEEMHALVAAIQRGEL